MSAAQTSHPEVLRLRRLFGFRPSLRRLLIVALLSAAYVTLTLGRLPNWAVAVPVLLAGLVAVVAIRGAVVSEWIAARLRFWQRRRRGYHGLPGRITEVDGCGVRYGDGYELVSAIELTADLAETRLTSGRAFAADTVPLDVLASMMTQYGLDVDIDVASAGQRVPPGPAYRASYAQGVRFYAAMAQRSTWLVLRVNVSRNLAGIVRRGPSRTAGPKALMSATRRLEQRLLERQIRARTLPAAELAQLPDRLSFGFDELRGREHWTTIAYDNAFATTYFVDPVAMSTEKLDRWWGLDTDSTAVVLRLRKANAQAPVEISGLVRYDTATTQIDNYDQTLVSAAGRQRELALATLPGGASTVVDLPSAPLTALAAVDIPVGPAGPVWGIADSVAFALPLYDASVVPESLRVEFSTDLTTAQLVLLRSVGAGASVAVHSDQPQRWQTLTSMLADSSRFWIPEPGDRRTADITVFDGVDVDYVPDRTLFVLRPTGAPSSGRADVTVTQITGHQVAVRIGRRKPIVVTPNPTDEELRYCDARPVVATMSGDIHLPPRTPRMTPTQPRHVPAPDGTADGDGTPQAPATPAASQSAAPTAKVPKHARTADAASGEILIPVSHGPNRPPTHAANPDRGAPPKRRPVRPVPPPPFERGTGAKRKTETGRWVRGTRNGAGPEAPTPPGTSRPPRQEPGAPRWTSSDE